MTGNPKYNWVVRYYHRNTPTSIHSFSEFKKTGKPGYAYKFDKIKKFKTYMEAFEVAKQIMNLGEYNVDVCRIHFAQGDDYYFTGSKL